MNNTNGTTPGGGCVVLTFPLRTPCPPPEGLYGHGVCLDDDPAVEAFIAAEAARRAAARARWPR